nr:pyrroloquinoline quinone precursor peptide PqqA [uncultured Lichenicoccus sp.]
MPTTGNRRMTMQWKKPVIVEIALGAEINSYASAGNR